MPMMLFLLAGILSINGWHSLSPNLRVSENNGVVQFQGQGSCYLDLTSQVTAPEINGIRVTLEGTGNFGLRLMLDTEGDTYIVAKMVHLNGEQAQIQLSKQDKQLLALRATDRNMPERLRLYLDADEPVNITIKGVETW